MKKRILTSANEIIAGGLLIFLNGYAFVRTLLLFRSYGNEEILYLAKVPDWALLLSGLINLAGVWIGIRILRKSIRLLTGLLLGLACAGLGELIQFLTVL